MKIYLKNVEVNYTEKRNYKGNFMYEEVKKQYPIGYIEHELIYGIQSDGLICPPKKLGSQNTGKCNFICIDEKEFKKAHTMIKYNKYEDWAKQELRKKLKIRISNVLHVIEKMITKDMFINRKAYSDKWNKIIGRIGYKYISIGFMQIINEIEKQVKN